MASRRIEERLARARLARAAHPSMCAHKPLHLARADLQKDLSISISVRAWWPNDWVDGPGTPDTPYVPHIGPRSSSRPMMRRRSSASSSFVLARSCLTGCGRSNWTPPTRQRDSATTRNDPNHNNSEPDPPPARTSKAQRRRVGLVRPLDTRGPHGCRAACARRRRLLPRFP